MQLPFDQRRYSNVAFQTPISSIANNNAQKYSGARFSLGPSSRKTNSSTNLVTDMSTLQLNDSSKRLSLAMGSGNIDPRRSSAFGSGKQSLVQSIQSSSIQHVAKDPRPIRDKNYQLECIKTLIDYLADSRYPHPISQKILTAPSVKDFQQIFKFIYGQLDPNYEWKKFEDEVPILLKSLRYPFASDISKSQLLAVGSMHAWPGLLAMLSWLVDLVKYYENFESHDYRNSSTHFNEISNTDNGNNGNHGEKMFFDYLVKAYSVFLTGGDNYDPMISELERNFEIKNSNLMTDVEILKSTSFDLEKRLDQLQSEDSPLEKAKREHSIYTNDVDKFQKYIAHLQLKQARIEETIQNQNTEINSLDTQKDGLEKQNLNLQTQIDSQETSPEEVEKMNNEKNKLQEQIRQLERLKEEAAKSFWDKELQMQKLLDQIENSIEEFNGFAFSEETLRLEFNPHAAKYEDLLQRGQNLHDIAQELRGKLYNIQQEMHSIENELIASQESREHLEESKADKEHTLKHLEEKLIKIVNAYTEDRQAFLDENEKFQQEMNNLEHAVQKCRQDIQSLNLSMQQRQQRMMIEYDETVLSITEEKEKIGTEIFQALEELINFKSKIEGTISDLYQAYDKESKLKER